MKDPELIIERLPSGDDMARDGDAAEVAAKDDAVLAENDAGDAEGTAATEATGSNETEAKAGDTTKRRAQKVDTLRQLKEQVSEDDDIATGKTTFRQILGGDYLLAVVRHYVWFIVLVVLLTCVYVGVRYQCQQDVIEINRLEKELVDAKYRAMSSSSNLTEICRQSNVLKVLGENEENKLMMAEQPPYIIEVGE